MDKVLLYDLNALGCSCLTTRNYSTSFSLGVFVLQKNIRPAIYAIYGFVRFADEIVDTFQNNHAAELLHEFREQTFKAIERRFSTNPILQSFQLVVNEYGIEPELIEAFLHSMEMDLTLKRYNEAQLKEYIYGSAEVVGLMCLRVFYKNDEASYQKLYFPARKLGEAFQKINFLRDLRSDFVQCNRCYFTGVDFNYFTEEEKQRIEMDIRSDFEQAFVGIKQLSKLSKVGVYLAYCYYFKLLERVCKTPAKILITKRIRISNVYKIWLLTVCWFKVNLKII
jgi:15-cis-phytoene synthase